jgi:hypothetical protein
MFGMCGVTLKSVQPFDDPRDPTAELRRAGGPPLGSRFVHLTLRRLELER